MLPLFVTSKTVQHYTRPSINRQERKWTSI